MLKGIQNFGLAIVIAGFLVYPGILLFLGAVIIVYDIIASISNLSEEEDDDTK